MSSDITWDGQSKVHCFGALVALVVALSWLVIPIPWWLLCIIVLAVDIYACWILGLAALRKPAHIPNRFPALFIMPALFLTLVIAFAGIYVRAENITWQRIKIDDQGRATGTVQRIEHPVEALYSSLETITTYGASATPASPTANYAVASELLSGALLLLMILPILAARLAGFDVESPVSKKIFLKKKAGEDWSVTRVQESEDPVKNSSSHDEMEVVITGNDLELRPPPAPAANPK